MQAATLIARYRPEPHPEGGYCRETRRSDTVIAHEALSERFSGQRHCSTAILLQPGNRDVSRLHRIRSDEIGYLIGYFYGGGSLRPAMVFPDGTASEVVPGQDIEAGQYVSMSFPPASGSARNPVPVPAFPSSAAPSRRASTSPTSDRVRNPAFCKLSRRRTRPSANFVPERDGATGLPEMSGKGGRNGHFSAGYNENRGIVHIWLAILCQMDEKRWKRSGKCRQT